MRIVTPAFILLVQPNACGAARAGFTASRRLGPHVQRNRARRRLRELARLLKAEAVAGADHVFIARPAVLDRPFPVLLADGRRALAAARRRLGA